MHVSIKHVSLFSAFKMGCAFTLVTTLFLGVPYGICTFAGMIPLISIAPGGVLKGIPGIFASGFILLVLIGILGAFSVAISWTMAAFFFNVSAWLTGGLNIKLMRRGKARQKEIDEPFREDDDNPAIKAASKNLDNAEGFLSQKRKHQQET